MTVPEHHRRLVTALATVTLTAFAALTGILLRPVLFDDSPANPAALSPVETGFLQDMLAHHQQAVEMGKLIDRPGVDPAVRDLGRRITVDQQFELGTMSGWLQLAGEPLQNPAPMAWMLARPGPDGHAVHDVPADHPMPGMSSVDEVAALGSLPVDQAENRFLIQMQRHHYGGIAMAQDLLAQKRDGLVARLATSMLGTQSRETGLMGAMLTQRGLES